MVWRILPRILVNREGFFTENFFFKNDDVVNPAEAIKIAGISFGDFKSLMKVFLIRLTGFRLSLAVCILSISNSFSIFWRFSR